MTNPVSRRIVLLTEGHSEPITAKTAVSLLRYRPAEIVAVLDSTNAGKTAQQILDAGGRVPVIGRLSEADSPNVLAIGIAPSGGRIPAEWRSIIHEAIQRGMDILSGMHEFLGNDPELSNAAAAKGVRLIDVRKNNERDVANRIGLNESCLRIHTVGNDCCVGKMVASIEVANGLKAAGYDAKFVATGQTGIMIEGDGCPIDCVVADFVNGAAERLVLQNQHHEVLVIEGQGSLAHPKYSAVTLGLLHGCSPHGMIMCYEVGRRTYHHMEHIPLQPLDHLIRVYEMMAGLMQPSRVIGVAMNSRLLTRDEASRERERVSRELGVPVCDVIRDGSHELVQAVLRLKSELSKRPA
jgi:uncharacterized NAD-dependent epimerase/dehydratase family protein